MSRPAPNAPRRPAARLAPRPRAAALAALAALATASAAHGAPLELSGVLDVLLLRDAYNTRLVVLSTSTLGAASGLVGTFLLLRKRSLMGDAFSHATLPGIALAFMVMVAAGGSGKYLPGLLLGALVTGLIGVGGVLLIAHQTRLKDDAALGIVLSVLFGLGIVLLGFVQEMPEGSAAGLGSFIYGKTASVVRSDLWVILGAAGAVLLACALLFKEFALLCFDEAYAGANGWPVVGLDILMMVLVAVITVVGLQAVGLILVIALLITPAAAARFWTQNLLPMTIVAMVIGGVSGWLGAGISALTPRLPAGATIVVVAAAVFVASMLFGSATGVLPRLARQARLARRIGRQHLLRAFFEQHERTGTGDRSFAELLAARSWSGVALRRELRRAVRDGLVVPAAAGRHRLTDDGDQQAARLARNHRLWEMYLITHADIAPSHVDRDADLVEHVLPPHLIEALEARLQMAPGVPPSPHVLEPEPVDGADRPEVGR